MVNAIDLEAILLQHGANVVEILVPDAETRRWTTAGEAIDKAGAVPGVDADRHLTSGKLLAVHFELPQRARVELHTALDVRPEVRRNFLGRQQDFRRLDADGDRSHCFPDRTRVEVQTKSIEKPDDRAARAAF